MHLAERARNRIFIHAGVVGWQGRAIVIPGRSFSGKSTLVAALLQAGATYYSDEFAVLDGRGYVHPFLARRSFPFADKRPPSRRAAAPRRTWGASPERRRSPSAWSPWRGFKPAAAGSRGP